MAASISQQHEGGNAFQGLVDCLFFPEVRRGSLFNPPSAESWRSRI